MRYATYKPLDELWLTSIPSQWNARKIKYLFSERSEKGYPNEPLLVASQNMGVVPKGVYGNRTVEATKDLHLLKLVRVGDFVISLRSFQGGLEYAYYQGIISPAYTIMVPNEHITSGYFKYLAKSRLFVELLKMCVTGIREGQNVDYTKLKNHQMPIPPRDEQDQIVRYLDWKVSKTNKLISALKKQIALLKEQKQAVINEAVTRGLDPDVSMKDSGVEWIGEIPAKWRKDKIPRLFSSIGSGTTPASGNAKYYKDGTIPWINSGDLYTDKKRVESAGKSVNELALTDYSVLKLYQEDACVIAMYGASIGNAAIVDFPFCCNQACCVLSNPREDLLLDYIYYCTSVFKRHLIEKSRGGGQPNISQDMIRKVWIPLPDLEVQKKIVEYLSAHCERIDDLIENINNEIALLGEYRRRLVSDVVTGQIDVRNIEVPEFEYITDEADDASDDENVEEMVDEEA